MTHLVVGLDCCNISGLVVCPSTRALTTFARRCLAPLAVSQPSSALSGWSHHGLTYFHQCLCAGNPSGCSPFALLSISGPTPTSGVDGRRPNWSIFGVMGYDRPGDPRVLGRNGDRGDIHVPALFQASRPCARGIGFSVYASQVRTNSVYEQCSYVRIALLGDPPQTDRTATGILARCQAERGCVVSPAAENFRITHVGHDRCRRHRANALDLHQSPRALTGPGQDAKLHIVGGDLPIELVQLSTQIIEHFARECWQAIFGIFENPWQIAAQAGNPNGNHNAEFAEQSPDLVGECCAVATASERARCTVRTGCCFSLLTATKWMLGRPTASQIALASLASFIPRRR